MLRTLSAVLVGCFLLQDFSFAHPDPKAIDWNRLEESGNTAWARKLLPEIPESVARVEDSWIADRGSQIADYGNSLSAIRYPQSMIYLIQDAHTNSSAQANLAKTLDLIFQKQKIKYVFSEGGSGNVSLSYLRSRASLAKRTQVAQAYLKQGILHGEEYLDLTSNYPFIIWGVDDKKAYLKSLKAYRMVAKERERLKAYLDRVNLTIRALKPRIYNPTLQLIDEAREKFLKEELPLTDYFDILKAVSGAYSNTPLQKSISLDDFPNLKHLGLLKQKESQIDFVKANQEQLQAIVNLSEEDRIILGVIPAEAGINVDSRFRGNDGPFKLDAAEHKAGRGFYAALEERLRSSSSKAPKGPRREAYPNLSQYFSYLKLVNKLNAKKVIEEKDAFEAEVFKSITETEDERELLSASKNIRILKKLMDLSVTPEEFKTIQSHPKDFNIVEITGFLNRKIMDLGSHYERALFLEPGFERVMKQCRWFYRLAAQRDLKFVENMLSVIAREQSDQSNLTFKNEIASAPSGSRNDVQGAILITGGFHAPHLKELLKKKNISFISITPQALHETNQKRYEKILFNQKTGPITPPHKGGGVIVSSPKSPSHALMAGKVANNPANFPTVMVGGRLAIQQLEKDLEVQPAVQEKVRLGARLAEWTPEDLRIRRDVAKTLKELRDGWGDQACVFLYRLENGAPYLEYIGGTQRPSVESMISLFNRVIEGMNQLYKSRGANAPERTLVVFKNALHIVDRSVLGDRKIIRQGSMQWVEPLNKSNRPLWFDNATVCELWTVWRSHAEVSPDLVDEALKEFFDKPHLGARLTNRRDLKGAVAIAVDRKDNRVIQTYGRRIIGRTVFKKLDGVTIRGIHLDGHGTLNIGGRCEWGHWERYSNYEIEIDVDQGIVTEARIFDASGNLVKDKAAPDGHRHFMIAVDRLSSQYVDSFFGHVSAKHFKAYHDVTIKQFKLDATGHLTIGGHSTWATWQEYSFYPIEIDVKDGVITEVRIFDPKTGGLVTDDSSPDGHRQFKIIVDRKSGRPIDSFVGQIRVRRFRKLTSVTIRKMALDKTGYLRIGRQKASFSRYPNYPVEIDVDQGMITEVRIYDPKTNELVKDIDASDGYRRFALVVDRSPGSSSGKYLFSTWQALKFSRLRRYPMITIMNRHLLGHGQLKIHRRNIASFSRYPGCLVEVDMNHGVVIEVRIYDKAGALIKDADAPEGRRQFALVFERRSRKLIDSFWVVLPEKHLRKLSSAMIERVKLPRDGRVQMGGKLWAQFRNQGGKFIGMDIDDGVVTGVRMYDEKGELKKEIPFKLAYDGKEKLIDAFYGSTLPKRLDSFQGRIRGFVVGDFNGLKLRRDEVYYFDKWGQFTDEPIELMFTNPLKPGRVENFIVKRKIIPASQARSLIFPLLGGLAETERGIYRRIRGPGVAPPDRIAEQREFRRVLAEAIDRISGLKGLIIKKIIDLIPEVDDSESKVREEIIAEKLGIQAKLVFDLLRRLGESPKLRDFRFEKDGLNAARLAEVSATRSFAVRSTPPKLIRAVHGFAANLVRALGPEIAHAQEGARFALNPEAAAEPFIFRFKLEGGQVVLFPDSTVTAQVFDSFSIDPKNATVSAFTSLHENPNTILKASAQRKLREILANDEALSESGLLSDIPGPSDIIWNLNQHFKDLALSDPEEFKNQFIILKLRILRLYRLALKQHQFADIRIYVDTGQLPKDSQDFISEAIGRSGFFKIFDPSNYKLNPQDQERLSVYVQNGTGNQRPDGALHIGLSQAKRGSLAPIGRVWASFQASTSRLVPFVENGKIDFESQKESIIKTFITGDTQDLTQIYESSFNPIDFLDTLFGLRQILGPYLLRPGEVENASLTLAWMARLAEQMA